MTKKNYIAIADIYNKNYANNYAFTDLLEALCKYFKEDNQAFNKERFIAACYREKLP